MTRPRRAPSPPVRHLAAAGTRRRWPRRLLIGVNVFVAVCLLATAGAYGYLKYRFGQVDKIDFACDVLRNCGSDDPDRPMNVLLVGSDSRKNISPEEREQFGSEREVGGQRSDTILVLHVDPTQEKAAILSIPRDLAVPIAGASTSAPRKINTAFVKGPEALIATIRQSLGIEIDHYAEVDFNGFRGIVDALGGVTLYFPSPARDRKTGLDVREPGCVRLDGAAALAYVRSRNYQYMEGGKWRVDPTGDLGRMQRQQDFVRRVIRKASRAGRNPVRLNSLVGTAVKNVRIDDAFSTKDVLRLARRFKSLEPDAVEMLSLPVVGGRAGGASVLRLKQPDAATVIARFNGSEPAGAGEGRSAPPKVVPGTVRVRVLNGSGTGGQAGSAAQALQEASFSVAGTGDADSYTYRSSVIRYGRGQAAKARLLQAYVEGGAQLREDRTVRGGDLVLVTGSTFRGIRPPAGGDAPPAPSPAGQAPATAAPPGPSPDAEAEAGGAPARPEC